MFTGDEWSRWCVLACRWPFQIPLPHHFLKSQIFQNLTAPCSIDPRHNRFSSTHRARKHRQYKFSPTNCATAVAVSLTWWCLSMYRMLITFVLGQVRQYFTGIQIETCGITLKRFSYLANANTHHRYEYCAATCRRIRTRFTPVLCKHTRFPPLRQTQLTSVTCPSFGCIFFYSTTKVKLTQRVLSAQAPYTCFGESLGEKVVFRAIAATEYPMLSRVYPIENHPNWNCNDKLQASRR